MHNTKTYLYRATQLPYWFRTLQQGSVPSVLTSDGFWIGMGRVISHALKGSSEQHWTHFCYWATEQISAMEQQNTFLLLSNGTHFCYWTTQNLLLQVEQRRTWTYYYIFELLHATCHSCLCTGLDRRHYTIWTTCCPGERERDTNTHMCSSFIWYHHSCRSRGISNYYIIWHSKLFASITISFILCSPRQ